ncbi:hypothetical protein GIB67_014515 [Kingdonia uniflora]|uniref:Uncharacterized protein n=1 Tax=Kingdonia uniflora TaxID=39325 RepID=A0A7J7NMM9_9MAGN|nr:hypothetical protein GIB67_014515 [Kingdonia uniflora]
MEDRLVVCFGEMIINFISTVGGVSLAETPVFKKAASRAPVNVTLKYQDKEGIIFHYIRILNNLSSDSDLCKNEGRLKEALLFANAYSAIILTEKGAIPAVSTREVILQILPKAVI